MSASGELLRQPSGEYRQLEIGWTLSRLLAEQYGIAWPQDVNKVVTNVPSNHFLHTELKRLGWEAEMSWEVFVRSLLGFNMPHLVEIWKILTEQLYLPPLQFHVPEPQVFSSQHLEEIFLDLSLDDSLEKIIEEMSAIGLIAVLEEGKTVIDFRELFHTHPPDSFFIPYLYMHMIDELVAAGVGSLVELHPSQNPDKKLLTWRLLEGKESQDLITNYILKAFTFLLQELLIARVIEWADFLRWVSLYVQVAPMSK